MWNSVEKTTCPLYIDNQKVCSDEYKEIVTIIVNEYDFCKTKEYINCPFYRILEKIEPLCDYVKDCPLYFHISTYDFEGLLKMTKNYCCSDNFVNCARYEFKKVGKEPPYDLLPEGKKNSI